MCSVSLQIIALNRVGSLRREVQDVRAAVCWGTLAGSTSALLSGPEHGGVPEPPAPPPSGPGLRPAGSPSLRISEIRALGTRADHVCANILCGTVSKISILLAARVRRAGCLSGFSVCLLTFPNIGLPVALSAYIVLKAGLGLSPGAIPKVIFLVSIIQCLSRKLQEV